MKIPVREWFIIFVFVFVLIGTLASFAWCEEPELWKGLVAESIGNYNRSDFEDEMYAVACVIRNREAKGTWHGLVSLKRTDLDKFIKENCDYVYNITGKRVESVAKDILYEVFNKKKKDTTGGSTLFEDIENFGKPITWDFSKIEYVCKIGTKTFFKEING